MLQRAASNAYSWWWASHIRTTQSKWLDANLQDMENRVKIMLKLLGQEADSFGKRAEMYYSTRPEVISHVEQVYRAYRALVERYDHISKELHKANHTIATACPEEVQYEMLEEENHDFPKAIMPVGSHNTCKFTVQEFLNTKRNDPSGCDSTPASRDMSTEEAQEEISRLQKAILILQTEKEYVKSSYESRIARYQEIEKQIADTQEEICLIQDKFDAHTAIHDDEARALMAITALRSCQGTISELVRHFEELIRIAAMESEKTKSLGAHLRAMNGNIGPSSGEASTSSTDTAVHKKAYPITQRMLELQQIYEKLDSFFANASESSIESVAGNVDQLVDKVINLEVRFPKQSAQINQLKQENENLKNKMDDLQDEMALRDDQSDLNEQLKLLENEFNTVRFLERSIVEEEVSVRIGFSQIFSCITNISKEIGSAGPEEESKGDSLGQDREDVLEGVNDNCNDVIHGSKIIYEEKLPENSLMQQVINEMHIHPDNRINPFISSENENGVDNSGERDADYSSEEVCQSSSETENGSVNFSQGKILKGEYPLGKDSQIHILHSGSIDTRDKEYDSNKQNSSTKALESLMEVAEGNMSHVISLTGSSVIQEEILGDIKSQNTCGQVSPVPSSDSNSLKKKDSLEESSLMEATCFNGADKSLDSQSQHINEAKSVEAFPGGQLNAPQKIENLNKCSQVESHEEDVCISLGLGSIQDTKYMIHVDAHSSEVRDDTSLSVPAGDSEKTDGFYQQVLEVVTESEKKSSNGKEPAREATTLMDHDSSQSEKSVLMREGHVPSWQEFLLDGLESGEAILLADYTSVLRNYKETKRKLTELEKKNQEHLEDTKAVIRELRNANSMKDVEIRSLRNLLDSSEMPPRKLDSNSNGFSSMKSFREKDRPNDTLDREVSTDKESSFRNVIESPKNTSLFEVRFRNDIDALLEENLQFLVRYSMACHHMQEFDTRYQEVQNEMENAKDIKNGEPGTATEPGPAEKKLRELRTELDIWFEQNTLLDQEVQLKISCLCRLQEEIAEALRCSSEMGTARFTPYEAAKFQGQVLNMQQSNSKIENELQAASERMRGLQANVNSALRELHESFDISSLRLSPPETQSSYKKQFKHFPSRTRVPLRNFLFGAKQKKKSIFACINPTFQKQFSDL